MRDTNVCDVGVLTGRRGITQKEGSHVYNPVNV